MAAGAGLLRGRRVLVMRDDRIGDLVLALPLIQGLKAAGAYVGLLASPYALPLMQADPRVDALIPKDAAALGRIKELRFDTALTLWAQWGNAWLAFLSGAKLRLGPSARPFSWLFNRRLPLRRSLGHRHESELNFDFGRALGLQGPAPAPRLALAPEAYARARAWLRRKGPRGRGPLVLLHVGSGGSAQPWPAQRFSALGLELKRRHKARLLFTAGPGEEAQAAACARPCGGALLAGELDLPAFAALLKAADLFAAGSTGPLHLAAAQGAPVLGLYPALRSMSPLRWAPRGSRRAVLSPRGLGFALDGRPGLNTLERVSVEEAASACAFLLRPRSKA